MLFPQDVSTTGFWVDRLFYLGFWLTAVAFALVVLILAVFLFKYRAQEGRKAYYTHGNSPKALMLTLGLALLVFVVIDINLAVHDHFAWEAIFGERARDHDPLKVEIMPEQFAWNIRYAGPDGKFGTDDDVVTVNDLHIPVDQPVHVALKSKDVIHSFFIPNFRIKQDAVPGMVTYLGFEATKTGKYDIACAEHCGLGHYRMRGVMSVESNGDFTSWIAKMSDNKIASTNWGWNWEQGK